MIIFYARMNIYIVYKYLQKTTNTGYMCQLFLLSRKMKSVYINDSLYRKVDTGRGIVLQVANLYGKYVSIKSNYQKTNAQNTSESSSAASGSCGLWRFCHRICHRTLSAREEDHRLQYLYNPRCGIICFSASVREDCDHIP